MNIGSQTFKIEISKGALLAELTRPADPKGLVLFVHGSGSDHRSPRNRMIAARLQHSGFATLLFDLRCQGEPPSEPGSEDLDVQTSRLIEVMDWVANQRSLSRLPLVLYGASTGSAVALKATVARKFRVSALISRSGRVDLAREALPLLQCPVLLQVGSLDVDVLAINGEAGEALSTRHQLMVVEGATHLFAEPGCLEAAADQSATWLQSEFGSQKIRSDAARYI